MQKNNSWISRLVIYNLILGALFGVADFFFFTHLSFWAWILWVVGINAIIGLIEGMVKRQGSKMHAKVKADTTRHPITVNAGLHLPGITDNPIWPPVFFIENVCSKKLRKRTKTL